MRGSSGNRDKYSNFEIQVMLRFERAMYENPDQDLNDKWWSLVEKYQLIRRPPARNAPDYASKLLLARFHVPVPTLIIVPRPSKQNPKQIHIIDWCISRNHILVLRPLKLAASKGSSGKAMLSDTLQNIAGRP